jgi:hypothetical protein
MRHANGDLDQQESPQQSIDRHRDSRSRGSGEKQSCKNSMDDFL